MKIVKKSSFILIFFILTGLFSASSQVKIPNKSMKSSSTNIGQKFVKDQYIIILKPDQDINEDQIKADFDDYDIILIKKIMQNMFLIEVSDDPGLQTLTDYSKNLAYIEAIQRNLKYQNIQ